MQVVHFTSAFYTPSDQGENCKTPPGVGGEGRRVRKAAISVTITATNDDSGLSSVHLGQDYPLVLSGTGIMGTDSPVMSLSTPISAPRLSVGPSM